MTPRQLKLLAFIRRKVAATGLPPSFQEMADHLGTSKSNAFRAAGILRREGHLVRGSDRCRSCWPAADVPVVVVRLLQGGGHDFLAFAGAPVRLLVIDEECLEDRVYEITDRFPPSLLAELVPAGSPIGSKHDDRHAELAPAIAARVAAVEADLDGRRHLETVK